jgi:hypothetical protein
MLQREGQQYKKKSSVKRYVHHTDSYPLSLISPEVKQPGLEADHSYLVPKSRMFFNILQENHDLNKTFICLEDLFRQKISGPDSKWC